MAQNELGIKWMKVCKVIWLIYAAFCIYFIWATLISVAIVFSAFPVYTVICAALCIISSILTVLAYTAVSSFCASRFKYIIALFAIQPISAGVCAYGSLIIADFGARLAISGVCFLINALAWSLPNIIYFMHRRYMFVGTDPNEDVKIRNVVAQTCLNSNTAAPEPATKSKSAPQAKVRIKVVPHRISGGGHSATETARQPLSATALQPNSQKQFDSKLVVIIVLAVLLVAAVAFILFDKGMIGINRPPQSKSEIIYIYGDSHYYHKESCYYHDNIPISKMMREDEAIKQGYSPCPLCKG